MSYNRYAYNDDKKVLPSWFLEDEERHNRMQLPITKEEARAEREWLKEFNARPSKKVA